MPESRKPVKLSLLHSFTSFHEHGSFSRAFMTTLPSKKILFELTSCSLVISSERGYRHDLCFSVVPVEGCASRFSAFELVITGLDEANFDETTILNIIAFKFFISFETIMYFVQRFWCTLLYAKHTYFRKCRII